MVIGQCLGIAGAWVIQSRREFEIAGDSLHVLLLVPKYVLSPCMLFVAWHRSGGLVGPTGECKIALKSLASPVCFLAGSGDFQVSMRLQLELCNMGSQWRDCCFPLQDLMVGGLECTSDCMEALLLDPFQELSNPLLFGWSQGGFQGGPDCCSIGET